MKSIVIPAALEQLPAVLGFITGELERFDCPLREQMQVELVAEEVFVNIASYAYAPEEEGAVLVECAVEEAPRRLIVRFTDGGKPFDPISRADADTSPEALQERVGGLGILLLKKNTNSAAYTYKDGKNILTFEKHF